jgi:ankyrin repeat protein
MDAGDAKFWERELLESVKRGQYQFVKEILERGANVDARDNKGTTALMWASIAGNVSIVSLLLEAGASVNEKDSTGNTPLLWASRYRRPDITSSLLEAGANVNAQDRLGNTPLIMASSIGNLHVVRMLRHCQRRCTNYGAS